MRRRRPLVAAFGVFDPLHAGHRCLLSHMVERAAELNTDALLLILRSRPSEVMRGHLAPYFIGGPDVEAIARGLSVAHVAFLAFDMEIAVTPRRSLYVPER